MAGVEESWLGGLCEYSDPADDLPPGGCHKNPYGALRRQPTNGRLWILSPARVGSP